MALSQPTDIQKLIVNDREQLIYLLTEAAEVEHGLMCSYLYAAWSLKQDVAEAVTEQQLAAIDSWRTIIHDVAIEEMLHLALVNNLLMSIGAPPHFSRPNFPVQPGYYPAGVVAKLMPFTLDVAEHFVYLERPEGMDLSQAKGFETKLDYERGVAGVRLTPTAQDYDTISHLYRGIEEGFRSLADRIGEERLFLGSPQAQVTSDTLSFDGLVAVTDVDSAIKAIATIIEQGEGGREDAEESHFTRFRAIHEEYASFLREDPGFMPYRPVAIDPVMFRPIPDHRSDQVQVTAKPAAHVLDLANASYGMMLRLLASGFGMVGGGAEARRSEINSAISVMSVVSTLGILLTKLACGKEGFSTGMNFHLPRSTLMQPQAHAGAAMLAERANEIADALEILERQLPIDRPLAVKLRKVAQGLVQGSA